MASRFAQKILSDAEFAIWQARSARWPERGVRYLATRFSAKEAFSKAIGLGMTMPMTWWSILNRRRQMDLIDEAASKIKIELDSKPEVMDKLDRRLIQLQIEREAVRREKDEASQKRFGLIE